MKHVIFWGATGQAKVLRDALRGEADLVALFDNRRIASPFAGVPIFQGDEGLASWEATRLSDATIFACVAIGGEHGSERLALQRSLAVRGYPPLTIVHPRAFVAGDATMGAGCQVLAHASICSFAALGESVIVNTGASVDHDCRIGDGVHVAPGAVLAGGVEVGECAFIGSGAVVLPRIRVGAHAIVGAGAVVTRDVAEGMVVCGNPARIHDTRASDHA